MLNAGKPGSWSNSCAFYFHSRECLVLTPFDSALGNEPQSIEEEYIIEPTGTKRRLKVPLQTPRRSEL